MATIEASKDNYLYKYSTASNYGNSVEFNILANNSTYEERGIIAFDIAALGVVSAATLYLWGKNITAGARGQTAYCARMLVTDWLEGAGGNDISNWAQSKTATNWNTAGAKGDGSDYTSTNQKSGTLPAGATGWFALDIKDLWNDAKAASQGLLSLILWLGALGDVEAQFSSRTAVDGGLHPYIDYTLGVAGRNNVMIF
jgi:hypothetical protein